ncbi:hypothetical protein OPW32_17415 [Vibrio europaeus]|uniref:hypothetical protein n=1 Tax=Vibrio europaeus TaxID=300876 RepID=UPI002340FE5F|nr:hypothetical protein [Vibrio europaeus]MDC5850977.1 hypothetical protein [Vibrio europaeus]
MTYLTGFSSLSYASASWYVGKVSRVALTGADGSFVVTFSNTALDDCKHKYAYFDGQDIGEGMLKNAYTLALTSLTTGLNMGIVIDKSVNGSGGQCKAFGMTADLRAN